MRNEACARLGVKLWLLVLTALFIQRLGSRGISDSRNNSNSNSTNSILDVSTLNHFKRLACM